MPRKYTDFLSANLFYMLCCYGMIIIGVFAALFGLIGGTDGFTVEFALQMIVVEIIAIALPPLFFIFFPYWKNFRKSTRLSKFNPSVLLAIPIGVIGYFFIVGITSVWMGVLSSFGLSPEAGAASIPPPGTPDMLLLSILAIAVSPALCEEFLFRGLILPAYERRFRRPIAAIVLSGLIFGLMHGQVTAAPGHILLGFVLAYVVVATDSIWAGIILHIIQNGIAMLILYFQDDIIAFTEQIESAASVAESAEPLQMIASGALYVVVFGIMYIGLLFLLNVIHKKRNGRGVFAAREEPAINLMEVQPMQPFIAQEPSFGKQFLTWLPLLVTMPLILFNYLSSFVMMIPGFMEWFYGLMGQV